jgi:hypothetical protein
MKIENVMDLDISNNQTDRTIQDPVLNGHDDEIT